MCFFYKINLDKESNEFVLYKHKSKTTLYLNNNHTGYYYNLSNYEILTNSII